MLDLQGSRHLETSITSSEAGLRLHTHDLLPNRLRSLLAAEGANVFTVEMLCEGVTTLSDLDALSSEPFALFFEPPSIDDRIVNRYAFFSVISHPSVALDVADETKSVSGRYPAIERSLVVLEG
jgi:hypothetical protein